MPKIVGFTGYAGSGKDTAADVVMRRVPNATKESFATPIKMASMHLFGLTHNQVYGDAKEVVDPRWNVTPRVVLQKLGTDFVRAEFGEGVFTKLMRERIESHDPNDLILVADVRFDNEAETIKSLGGIVIKIVRVERRSDHASENGVSERLIDHVVDNRGSLEDLETKIMSIVESL